MVGALGACGGDGDGDEVTLEPGSTLTVYMSAPREGDSAAIAEAATAGARLALREAGGEAGGHDVRLVRLNSSAREPGLPAGPGWEPGMVARNAQRAASNPRAVAYIGELDLGGSAISVPITNEAELLQISPGDGLTSLTRSLPGGAGTGPERYYPRDERNFLRLVPTDFLQASALVEWAREADAGRIAVLHDGEIFGRELASEAGLLASCQGLEAAAVEEVGADPAGYPDLAEDLAEERPDAVIYAGAGGDVAPALAAALREELPRARLYGTGGVSNSPAPRVGGPDALIPPRAGAIRVTRAARPAGLYPRTGRRALRRLSAMAGAPVPVDALYGYEAMAIVLDAVEAEGDVRDREDIRDRALAPRTRRSVLGRYRIEPTGDVSESRFAGYRRELGALAFQVVRRPAYELAPPSPKLAEPAAPCGALLRIGRANQ